MPELLTYTEAGDLPLGPAASLDMPAMWNASIHYYLMNYGLRPGHDSVFSFKVSRHGVLLDGTPSLSLQIQMELKQSPPDEALEDGLPRAGWRSATQSITNATLALVSPDASFAQVPSTYTGTVEFVLSGNGFAFYTASFTLSGPAVILAFACLRLAGTATLTLNTTYLAYHRLNGTPFVQQSSWAKVYTLPLGQTYADDSYLGSYLLDDGSGPRPILSIDDLRGGSSSASAFQVLSGAVDLTHYPSVSQLYVGAASRTVVAIPQRYCISRDLAGPVAGCGAVIDSQAGAAHFKFDLTLAPAFSAVEWAGLAAAIKAYVPTAAYTLSAPQSLDSSGGTLLSGFKSAATFGQGLSPHTYSALVTIEDDASGLPAIAAANLFIRQLCAAEEPFLGGTLAVRLDSILPAITVPFDLTFSDTAGIMDELAVAVDTAASVINLTSRSTQALKLQRYALTVDGTVKDTYPSAQLIGAKATVALPMPEGTLSDELGDVQLQLKNIEQLFGGGSTGAVSLPGETVHGLLVEAQLDLTSSTATQQMLRVDVQDLRSIVCNFGIAGYGLNWVGSGLASIDVMVTFADTRVAPIALMLDPAAPLYSGTTSLFLQTVVTGLLATIVFTWNNANVTSTPRPDSVISVDFLQTPIALVPPPPEA